MPVRTCPVAGMAPPLALVSQAKRAPAHPDCQSQAAARMGKPRLRGPSRPGACRGAGAPCRAGPAFRAHSVCPLATIHTAFTTLHSVSAAIRNCTGLGEDFWARREIKPRFDAVERNIGFVSVQTDITAMKASATRAEAAAVGRIPSCAVAATASVTPSHVAADPQGGFAPCAAKPFRCAGRVPPPRYRPFPHSPPVPPSPFGARSGSPGAPDLHPTTRHSPGPSNRRLTLTHPLLSRYARRGTVYFREGRVDHHRLGWCPLGRQFPHDWRGAAQRCPSGSSGPSDWRALPLGQRGKGASYPRKRLQMIKIIPTNTLGS